jgi:ABC-type amino acid transport substrate-binding protein
MAEAGGSLKMKRLLTGLSLWLMVLGSPAKAAPERMDIIMPAWGLTLQADGTGLFNALFDFVMAERRGEVEVSYVSYETMLRLLVNKSAACAYPLAKATLLSTDRYVEPDSLIESLPPLVSKTYLFTRPGEPIIRASDSLKDKLLIQIHGENYNHNSFAREARFLNVETEADKVRLLLAGRGHGMLASMPDILFSMQALDAPALPHDDSFSLFDYNNSVLCRRVPDTEAFVAYFDARVRALLADGSLKAFIAANGVPAADVENYLPVTTPR